MSNETKNIVIIGGGYAGVEALVQLSAKKLNKMCIVLISKSNFFYHNVASPRTLVQSGLNESICIPFDNVVNGKNNQFIHGMFFYFLAEKKEAYLYYLYLEFYYYTFFYCLHANIKNRQSGKHYGE